MAPCINLELTNYAYSHRTRALYLCEWYFENERDFTQVLEELESSGDFTRAAALAIFNLKIRRAIQSLTRGAQAPVDAGGDANYNSVAMALAGFNDKSSLWREMCRSLRKQFDDCYLKAIFAFLTCDNNDHHDILVCLEWSDTLIWL